MSNSGIVHPPLLLGKYFILYLYWEETGQSVFSHKAEGYDFNCSLLILSFSGACCPWSPSLCICHCRHVWLCPLFTRFTCLYGRDTCPDAQTFIILHWVTLTSFPLFIVSIKHIFVSRSAYNPHNKSLVWSKIYFPNMKLCHGLVCGRSLILFYRLCLYFIIYFHFLLYSWKKFDPAASGGQDGGQSLFLVWSH